jgi:hypothetical protein
VRGEAGGPVVLQILQGPRVMSDEGEGGRMRQVYLLYLLSWYESTNTGAALQMKAKAAACVRYSVYLLSWSKVQMLTLRTATRCRRTPPLRQYLYFCTSKAAPVFVLLYL